jgi:hypothetical protein
MAFFRLPYGLIEPRWKACDLYGGYLDRRPGEECTFIKEPDVHGFALGPGFGLIITFFRRNAGVPGIGWKICFIAPGDEPLTKTVMEVNALLWMRSTIRLSIGDTRMNVKNGLTWGSLVVISSNCFLNDFFPAFETALLLLFDGLYQESSQSSLCHGLESRSRIKGVNEFAKRQTAWQISVRRWEARSKNGILEKPNVIFRVLWLRFMSASYR